MMTSTSRSEHIAFIIGAGFNGDAAVPNDPVRYPLVKDLARECFDSPVDPDDVEEEFQAALSRQLYSRDHPLDRLRYLIMRADWTIAPELCRTIDDPGNPYGAFLQRFVSAPFVSFNYDVLLELLLFRLGVWEPKDGFGVAVRAPRQLLGDGASCSPPDGPPMRSRTMVLHLHGSYAIYPVNVDHVFNNIRAREEPYFVFDHYLFPPFAGATPSLDRVPFQARILAPVPNKAEGLKGDFVGSVYEKAVDVLRRRTHVVAIGYRFNEHDRESYRPLLEAIAGGSVLVVSPDADASVSRLVSEHPKISWTPLALTFAQWAALDFPLA